MSSQAIDIPGAIDDHPVVTEQEPQPGPLLPHVPKVLQNSAVAGSYEKLHEMKMAKNSIGNLAQEAAPSPLNPMELPVTEPPVTNHFPVTSAVLSKLVNFDERNSKELIVQLKKYGGTPGIAKLLSVDLEKGLVSKSEQEMIQKSKIKAKKGKNSESVIHSVTDGEIRQKEFGLNFVEPPETDSIFKMIWETIKEDTIIKVLLFGALLTLIIGVARHPADGWIDGTAIMVAVVIVLSVTAGNDYSKDKKFKKLLMLQSEKKTKVLRDGKVDQISSWDIVVGDIVELQPGDEVPADGLFVSGNRLQIDESPLTGETLPVKKNPENPFLFSGCQVGEGSGFMLVTAVGPKSSAGQIQALLNEKQREETALQEKLAYAAVQIGQVGVAAGLFTFIGLTIRWAINFALGKPWNVSELNYVVDFFVLGVTVVVVAVPEGLPLAVTIALAFSMFKMIRDNCFVRQLAAAETMGQATCICTDKTGTLTENRMAVVRFFSSGAVYSGEGSGDQDAKPFSKSTFPEGFCSLLCESISVNSTCFVKYKPKDPLPVFVGSSTEGALLVMTEKLGAQYEHIREAVKKVPKGELPFSSERKRMATLVEPVAAAEKSAKSKFRSYVKGASEIVLGLCTKTIDANSQTALPISTVFVEEVSQLIKKWASEGLRTLVLAYKDFHTLPAFDEESGFFQDLDSDLVFLGLVAIKDPIRKEVPNAVAASQQAGIIVRMVTGDNILTACSIAKECRILDNSGIAMEGPIFRNLTKEEKIKVIPRLQVLARSSPTDKYVLVSLLREIGEVVAVTGDGTNDAPALKAADVGFAMGISGTQVAMNACSIVLLDDNFASIVQACRWGRNVLEVIRKFLQFQLSVNLAAIIITFIGSIIEGRSPLSAVQLLWVNLIMDSLGALALASEEPDEYILLKAPQTRNARIITKSMAKYIFAMTIFQVAIHLFVLFDGYRYVGVTYDDTKGRHTLVFTTFILMQVVNEVMARQLEMQYNFVRGIFKNPLFLSMLLLILIVQVIAVQFGGSFVQTVPLNATQWGGCTILALTQIPYVLLSRVAFRWYDAYKKDQCNTVKPFEKAKSSSLGKLLPVKQVKIDKVPLVEPPSPMQDSVKPMVNNLVQ